MRHLLFLLFLVSTSLQSVLVAEAKPAAAAVTVISVARNGSITIGTQRIKLKDLLATLSNMGVTSGSQISVQGDEGAKIEVISRVLETLVDGGLLPKDAVD